VGLLAAIALWLASALMSVWAREEPPCCGPISAKGEKLAALLDGMDVESHWPAHEHVNWETGDPDHGGEYEGVGHTHCSAFAADAAKKMSVYLLRPSEHGQKLLANAQVEWLASVAGREHLWSGVRDQREAQSLENRGSLVVVVFPNPDAQKPGHVAVLRPSEKTMRALLRDGPQITQVGTHNHTSSVVGIGFSSHPARSRTVSAITRKRCSEERQAPCNESEAAPRMLLRRVNLGTGKSACAT
jgi:hypothetical protein